MEILSEYVKRLGYLFYLVDPKQSSFENINEVPDYITQVIPYFVSLIVIEQIILFAKNYRFIRVNDAIASLSQGILMELSKTGFKGFALMYYIYIYQNWRVFTLEWHHTSTWIIAFITVDFGFYWFHRFTHEMNILWAAHQVHHSSQEYNLTTALRQSVLHLLFQYIFYLPSALVIPPAVFLVHNQFNVLYQFWIHTQLIGTMGPLEYILNTPSHHRVHHGKDDYCIDKNYGGVLIIWDRLFGTFQQELHYISYGLTTNIKTFNPFNIQMHHYFSIFCKFFKINGFKNKYMTLFASPAWDVEPIAQQKCHKSVNNDIYDPQIPIFQQIYVLIHFAIIILIHTNLMQTINVLSHYREVISLSFICLSLTSFGFIMDRKYWSKYVEIFRSFSI
ncbi:alkylglycerol monooxygenase-like [Oppia nitens]|uniref:alkylglycerol monooxygenase-like n=1 Tax=Oppia nitens TaxID=1686743 RepID=UPI0023DA6F7F|nr:alkylglycerol monooxygenase-like [Oppia nitens]